MQGGSWVEVPFSQITKGDVVRLYEPTGEPVRQGSTSTWIAMSDAFRVEGIWTFEMIPLISTKGVKDGYSKRK